MVAPSSCFSLLAGLFYLAARSFPPADAAAIYHDPKHPVSSIHRARYARLAARSGNQATLISLPPKAQNATSHKARGKGKATKKESKKKGKGKSHHKGGKRSVIISDKNGASYMVPQSRRGATEVDGLGHRSHRREQDSKGVPGTVDIISPVVNAAGKTIASLFMESAGNTTDNPAPFVLNASEHNKTLLYMVAGPSTASNSDTPVSLRMDFFNPSEASMEPYCATFDPNPPTPKPLTMESCFDQKTASSHKSQVFSYNSDSGVVRPMWFNGEDDGKTDEKDRDPETPSGANVTSVNGTDSTGNSTDSANSTLATRDQMPAEIPAAQNVTLVFNPYTPEVSSRPKVDAVSDSTNSSAAAITSTITTTTSATQTMTTTVTTSLAAAMDVTSSSSDTSSSAVPTTSDSAALPSSSSMSAADVESTSVASTTSQSASTASTSASTSASSQATASSAAKLDVEVVGPSTTSATQSSSTDVSASAPASQSSDSLSTSASVDAQAVASGIAESVSTSTTSASDSSSITAASESSSASSTSVTTTATSTVAADAVDGSSTASSSMMTPVSTAPYEWMFQPEQRL